MLKFFVKEWFYRLFVFTRLQGYCPHCSQVITLGRCQFFQRHCGNTFYFYPHRVTRFNIHLPVFVTHAIPPYPVGLTEKNETVYLPNNMRIYINQICHVSTTPFGTTYGITFNGNRLLLHASQLNCGPGYKFFFGLPWTKQELAIS